MLGAPKESGEEHGPPQGRPATFGEACEAPGFTRLETPLEFGSIGSTSDRNGNKRDNQQDEVSPHWVGSSVRPLVLIIGPMFAGKTTDLIRRFRLARDVGEYPLLVKATSDTRYAAGQV